MAAGGKRCLYEVLGLGRKCTSEEIRSAYKKLALQRHPDKLTRTGISEAEATSAFQELGNAYEILSDERQRRCYDSTRNQIQSNPDSSTGSKSNSTSKYYTYSDRYDEDEYEYEGIKIPRTGYVKNFYKFYSAVLEKNGRFSVVQPVKSLGNDKTPMDEVDRFYEFWYSFKSNRECSLYDSVDLEEAESSEQRKWMEKRNAKETERARKIDCVRMKTLIDRVYRDDPRIARRKREQKAEKEKEKEKLILKKKLEEEKAATFLEMERLMRVEEEKKAAEVALNMKKLKEKEKKLVQKERKRLRAFSTAVLSERLLDLTDIDLGNLCSILDKDQLVGLCDSMEGKEDMEKARLLKETLDSSDFRVKYEKEVEKNTKQHNDSPAVEVNWSIEEKPWNKEEIDLLRKGVVKYPKGTSRRWEVVSEYIGTGRPVEEILKATKTVLLQKPDNSKAFESFLEKRKAYVPIVSPLSTRDELLSSGNVDKDDFGLKKPELISDSNFWSVAQEISLVQALKTFPKEIPQRWERIAEAVSGKTVGQCKKKFLLMKENFKNNSSVPEKVAINPATNNKFQDSSKNSNDQNGIFLNSDTGDIWSEVQEKALIQALKTFPKDVNQRWESISAAVPGKTVNQCKKKFTSWKENIRSKKNAA